MRSAAHAPSGVTLASPFSDWRPTEAGGDRQIILNAGPGASVNTINRFSDLDPWALVNALTDNNTRDAGTAKRLARFSSLNTEEELFQTSSGEFFLRITETYFRGRRLGPYEGWRALGITQLPDQRLQSNTCFRQLSKRQAMEWCIKTQVPETFRGYLLDCC